MAGSGNEKAQSRETGPCWGNRNAGRSGKQLSERDGVDLLLDGVQQLGLQQSLLTLDALLLGGEPLGHRHLFWNFVSSSRERIEQAKQDWTAGRFQLPPNDNQEWIPLPGTPEAPAAPSNQPGAGSVPPANAS